MKYHLLPCANVLHESFSLSITITVSYSFLRPGRRTLFSHKKKTKTERRRIQKKTSLHRVWHRFFSGPTVSEHGSARRVFVQRRHGRRANSFRLAHEAGVFDHSTCGALLLYRTAYDCRLWLTSITTVNFPELSSYPRTLIPEKPSQDPRADNCIVSV